MDKPKIVLVKDAKQTTQTPPPTTIQQEQPTPLQLEIQNQPNSNAEQEHSGTLPEQQVPPSQNAVQEQPALNNQEQIVSQHSVTQDVPTTKPVHHHEPTEEELPLSERKPRVVEEEKTTAMASSQPVSYAVSGEPSAVQVTAKAPPWMLRDPNRKPTVKEVADFSMLTPPQKDVVQEYRKQASREILPPTPQGPLTVEEERAKAKQVAQRILEMKNSHSFFDKIKRRIFG